MRWTGGGETRSSDPCITKVVMHDSNYPTEGEMYCETLLANRQSINEAEPEEKQLSGVRT